MSCKEWRLLNAIEEVQAFGPAPEFVEVTDRPGRAALQFADSASLSWKKFPESKAIKEGLETWASSEVKTSQLAYGTCPSDIALAWVGWPQQLPLPPKNELACLWRIAHEDQDSCQILRGRLGFASVFAAKQNAQRPFEWHIALGCAMSYFPESFPHLPQWVRRAALPEPCPLETTDSITTYLQSFQCLVARSEGECRSEDGVRPTLPESQSWQELKRFEISELQRFKGVEMQLAKRDLVLRKKTNEVDAKIQLNDSEMQTTCKELNDVKTDP